jgi:hypothetical protein
VPVQKDNALEAASGQRNRQIADKRHESVNAQAEFPRETAVRIRQSAANWWRDDRADFLGNPLGDLLRNDHVGT